MLERRLLSRPIKVHWAGWESDTYRLQQAGWELSVEELPYERLMRLVIRSQRDRMIGQSGDLDFDHWRALEEKGYLEGRIWQMRHMAGSLMVHNAGPVEWNFRAIDATPRLVEASYQSLEDLVHFAGAPIVQNRALVLPEATVDVLLKEILARQEGAKLAYFEDLVSQERVNPPPKFHAQIISLEDFRKAA